MDFEKLELKNEVWIFWPKPHFWSETFFQEPLENFLWTLQPCSRYWKGPPSVALYVSKKIMTIRHANQKLWTETSKKPKKLNFPLDHCRANDSMINAIIFQWNKLLVCFICFCAKTFPLCIKFSLIVYFLSEIGGLPTAK